MASKRTLVVSGASGQLGRRVVELVSMEKDVRVIAVTRSPEKLAGLVGSNVEVRRGDFDDEASLAAAFTGGERLLLISTDAVDRPGRRVEQHQRAVRAAKVAGIRHILYTSVGKAETSGLLVAKDHLATEQAIQASGLGWTFLRNNLYMEGALMGLLGLPHAVTSGKLMAALGTGAAALVTREDCAQAAAAALVSKGAGNRVLEITGPTAVTGAEIARLASAATGKAIAYVDVPPDAVKAGLLQAQLPELIANLIVDFHVGIAKGDLAPASGDFTALTGRKATSVEEYLRATRSQLLQSA